MPLLNTSYVLTSSRDFRTTLDDIVVGLNKAGFSKKDYRIGEIEKAPFTPDDGEQQTISEPEVAAVTTDSGADWFDTEIPDDFRVDTSVVGGDDTIKTMVATATQATEKYDEELNDESNNGFLGGDLGDMLNQYPMQEQFKDDAASLRIPQFFLKGSHEIDVATQGEAIPKYRRASKSESDQIREYLRTI